MRGALYLWITTFLGVGSLATAVDPPVQEYLRESNICKPPAGSQPENIPPVEGILLPLNHSDTKSKKFCNRFWVKDQFYKAGGPVFIYHAGESEGEKSFWSIGSRKDAEDYQLTFFEMLLKNFNGMGILMEHRYYGKSIPEGVNIQDRRDADFKWHTTDLALEDVHRFAWSFSRKKYSRLTPNNTPWISIGGSYSGVMAALLRQRYAETISAAYASSAPIQAAIEMPGFYEQIWYGMNATHPACAADLSAAIQAIDKKLKDPKQDPKERRKLKESLLGCWSEEISNALFADWMASMFKEFQYYGVSHNLQILCEHIEIDPANSKKSGPEGWAVKRGVSYVIGRLQDGSALKDAAGNFGNCTRTSDGQQVFRIQAPRSDDISWTWQRCNEWGYFHVANVGKHQIVLSDKNVTSQQEFCTEYFINSTSKSLMRSQPDAGGTNRKYGGWNIRPSRVFWTAGQFDPWTALTPFSADAKAIIRKKLPVCNQDTSPKGTVFGYQLNGAEHCFDFRRSAGDTSSRDTNTTIALFTDALKIWLTCKKPTPPYDTFEL
ncbi:serine carboxypeptidase S28-domain-containing protein [Hyaloscypha finlandica]|nr:serine carboxypeptidase S28-domain-containing protein [Hyaloscypha finlandica]